MKYGSHLIKQIFHDKPFLVVDYINPGYELAHYLSQKKLLPQLIFLKNHGIIVHGKDTTSCVDLIQQVHTRIERYLKDTEVFIPFKLLSKLTKTQNYIFPDSAVFSNIDFKHLSLKKKEKK